MNQLSNVKRLDFSRLKLKYQNNIKKTWNVFKDAIGKTKSMQSRFPDKIIYNTKAITDVHLIVKHFNSYFTEIGQNLANKIEKSSMKAMLKNAIVFSQNIHLVLTNLKMHPSC